MSVDPSQDPRDFSRHMAFFRGWTHGAGGKPMDPDFESHSTLGPLYSEGYTAGRHDRNEMAIQSAKRFNVSLSPIRAMKTEPETTPA